MTPYLDEVGDELAIELAEAHSRVRAAARERTGGISAKAERPADVLGVYIFLPVVGS